MIDYEYCNAKVLRLLSDYLNYCERSVTAEQIADITSLGVSKEYAFRTLLLSLLGIEDEIIKNEYFANSPKLLNADDYKSNPYYKNVLFGEKTRGKWTLGRGRYEPYELFVADDFVYDGDKVIPSLGFFDRRFSFPAVYEDGRLWMSVTPNEVNTMREPISAAVGNMLTFGLGLGYFAYMCSLKPEVNTVTVVERDGSVIDLFTRYILPQFKFKDKIRIVQSDAYDYLNAIGDGVFDRAFVDIYRDAGDGRDVYVKFKRLIQSKNFNKTKFDFWIEKTIKYYL